MENSRHRSLSLLGLVFAAVMVLGLSRAQADNLKVFLLGGQSNMVGQAPASGLPTTPVNLQQPQDDVLFYYGSSILSGYTMTTLRPGSGSDFGPEITFGRDIADASPSIKYALIKYAANGTALHDDWAPGTGPEYIAFRDAVDSGIAALQAAGHATEIVGMLWHQGESDAIDGQHNNYQTNLTNFIADIRSHYGADLPFLIGETRLDDATLASQLIVINNAKIAIAAADPYAVHVPAADLNFQDRWHFDSASQMILGERFADAFINNFFPVYAGVDMITWSGQAVPLNPRVINTDTGDPQAALTYSWSANPADGVVFSATNIEAPTVTITKATSNPSMVILTLAVNNVGSSEPDITDTMTVYVYDDACKAAIAAGLGSEQLTDIKGSSCRTDLQDLAELGRTWLADTSLPAPEAK